MIPASVMQALQQMAAQQGGYTPQLTGRTGLQELLVGTGAGLMAQSDAPGQGFFGNLGRALPAGLQMRQQARDRVAQNDQLEAALAGAPESMKAIARINPQAYAALMMQPPAQPDYEYRDLEDGTVGVFLNGRLVRQQGPERQPEDTTFADTDALRKEFNDEAVVQVWRDVKPAYESALKSLDTDTRAGDLDLIYAVAKAVDPNSVVREGEAMMVTDAASPAQRFLGLWQYVTQGEGRLTEDTRRELMGLVENRMSGHRENYNQALGLYRGIAERRSLPLEDIFMGGSDPVPNPLDPFSDLIPR